MKIQEARDRIFVALDFGNSDKVASLVPDLVPYVGGFKIGLELISAVGGAACSEACPIFARAGFL